MIIPYTCNVLFTLQHPFRPRFSLNLQQTSLCSGPGRQYCPHWQTRLRLRKEMTTSDKPFGCKLV